MPVVAPPAVEEGAALAPSSWAVLDGETTFECVSSPDAEDVTVSAWVWLLPGGVLGEELIASNSLPGCGTGSPVYSGFTLSVSPVTVGSAALNGRWSSSATSCSRVSNSSTPVIPTGVWVFVTLILSGGLTDTGHAVLCADGASLLPLSSP